MPIYVYCILTNKELAARQKSERALRSIAAQLYASKAERSFRGFDTEKEATLGRQQIIHKYKKDQGGTLEEADKKTYFQQALKIYLRLE